MLYSRVFFIAPARQKYNLCRSSADTTSGADRVWLLIQSLSVQICFTSRWDGNRWIWLLTWAVFGAGKLLIPTPELPYVESKVYFITLNCVRRSLRLKTTLRKRKPNILNSLTQVAVITIVWCQFNPVYTVRAYLSYVESFQDFVILL
jgi:hypothetical protein